MLIRIFKQHTEPLQYGNFCPGARCDIPVLIGGSLFHSLRQFLLFNLFIDADAEYANLFISNNEATLKHEFSRLYAKEFGSLALLDDPSDSKSAVDSSKMDEMLDYMKRPETYVAFKKLVFSPAASDFFVELEARFRPKAPDLLSTWIAHRFADTLLDRPDISFVSDDYVQYATALNKFFGQRKYRAKRMELATLSRVVRPEVCLLDLVFKRPGSRERKTEARQRLRFLPDKTKSSAFERLHKLFT